MKRKREKIYQKVSFRPLNDAGRRRLDIRDTGIGIPAEALPHVFERFFRAEPSRSKEFEGAGLGLALVKWVAENHHGRVGVESEVGKGSCFTIWLPLAPAPERQLLTA